MLICLASSPFPSWNFLKIATSFIGSDCDMVGYGMLKNIDSRALLARTVPGLEWLMVRSFPHNTTACLWGLVALTGSPCPSLCLLLSCDRHVGPIGSDTQGH